MVDSTAPQSAAFAPMRTTVGAPAAANQAVAADSDLVKIEIKDLNFYYDKFHALKNVSLALYDRKVTAFVGPSGCGKSTLLRVLNRTSLMKRTTGEIRL